MCAEAYKEWISIYSDDIKAKWESERSDLRKISMIYWAFHCELQKLKNELDSEMEELKFDLKRKDFLLKSKNFVGLAKSQWFDEKLETDKDKENQIPETVPLKEINQNEIRTKYLTESPNSIPVFDSCPSPPLITSNSPINRNCSNSKKRSPSNSSLILYPVINHKIEKTPKLFEKQPEETKTPNNLNDSNIMECSIIEETPDLNPSKRIRTNKLSLRTDKHKKLKLSQNKQELTPMYFKPKKKKKKEIDSQGPSMSINAMINLINQNSESETDDDLDKTSNNLDAAIDKTPDGLDKNVPRDMFSSFIQNYDKVPEKKNEVPNYIYNEVVRGQERKKLQGWACRECEDYYKGLNLPPEEIQAKKNQCSRHRHKFKPREETYQGFWDLTFGPTPKTQE